MKHNPSNLYITSQADLQSLIASIREVGTFSIDTEFTRETTYYPILSIIQIALKNAEGKKESYIIDCLCNLDLKEFFSLIANPTITKILHSSAQDLQIFHHKSGFLPSNIIDTQIMANFSGLGFSVGYSNLVNAMFSVQLDKKQQRSDWQRRPLNKKQIEYAILDVLFLEEIYHRLSESLVRQSREGWFHEEMENFITKTLFKSDDSLSKNFSFRNKNPKQITQIKDIICWREHWARKIDIPRQHFLKDEIIEKIVLNQEVKHSFTKEMLEEIQEILDKEVPAEMVLPSCEKNLFMNDKQKNCYLEAKKILAKICAEKKFKEQFLITSSDLKKAICKVESFGKIVSGWRYQLFGRELEQLIMNL